MPTLHWLSRDLDLTASSRVPYRLLEAVPELSYGDPDTGNMLIQGDNLDALKALLPVYAGRVKCIFIDPPYNTHSAFEHYDDNLEHAQWLSMMYPRLELLRDLLGEHGSIWVTIDDNEAHYLKVVMDEIFGRGNFITNVIWRKNYSPKSSARHFSEDHDHILVYAKNADRWIPNPMPRTDKQDKAYKNPDKDPRGPWKPSDLSARNFYSLGRYSLTTPSGRLIDGPPGGNYWRVSEANFWQMDKDKRVWWGTKGDSIPQIKRFLSEVKQGITPQTFWSYEEVGHTQEAKQEILALFERDVFITPKPERLIERVIRIATMAGDLVLDSFVGSGTTSAVAQKLKRRFISIEVGGHAETHCVPRLRKVVDGEQGGISESASWKGGGGFRFYRLGSAIFDEDGNINPKIKFAHLAAHVWFTETLTPLPKVRRTPLLGVHAGVALYLLYNGILHDRRPESGNVLTRAVLDALEAHDGPRTIYGESSRLSPATLKRLNITFKQTPYDVRAR